MSDNQSLLRFSKGNAKLDKRIWTFSLPSGHTCPGAKECLARANPETGHITDGLHAKYRCFSASAESAFPSVRKSRHNNHDLLIACRSNVTKLADLIRRSLPKNPEIVRIHVGGDFYSQAYFDAWLKVIAENPETLFYAYTKSLKFWVARRDDIPENFSLIASRGGRYDYLIAAHKLRDVVVVFHPDEVGERVIDHDDSLVWNPSNRDVKVALLIHGQQPKGSKSGAATKRLRDEGVAHNYGKGKDSIRKSNESGRQARARKTA
jgi:hypothetical protein